jgi:hypothetical protein
VGAGDTLVRGGTGEDRIFASEITGDISFDGGNGSDTLRTYLFDESITTGDISFDGGNGSDTLGNFSSYGSITTGDITFDGGTGEV